MADITQPRWQSILRRAFAIKTADPGRVLHPIIGGTFEVQDTYRPESRALRAERAFSISKGGITNTAAVNFGIFAVCAAPGGRIAVLKRATFSFSLPTAANQPGNVYAIIEQPNTTLNLAPGLLANLKDFRAAPGTETAGPTTTFANLATSGVQNIVTAFGIAAYAEQVFPGAAVTSSRIQVDNLDLVIGPPPSGNPWSVAFGVRGDTLPVASWNWNVCVEGYEFSPDASELLSPPP